jgi:chromosome segregation ATPase
MALLPFLLAACDSKPDEELTRANQDLLQQLKAKDDFINEVTSTISEINNEVEKAWAEQKRIVRKASSVESGETMTHAELKKQIIDRIEGMSASIAESRKKIGNLERKLKTSENNYTGLHEMVEDL